jgi:hypothetical protein
VPESCTAGEDVLGDARRADRVSLTLQPTGQVHRQPAVSVDEPFVESTAPSASWRDAMDLVPHQFCDGEAVVQLDEVQVAELDARHGPRSSPCGNAARELQRVPLGGRQEVVGLPETEELALNRRTPGRWASSSG